MEMLWDLCEEINESSALIEEIKARSRSILSKKDISKSLEDINILSYLLYAQNKIDTSFLICERLKQIDFNNNYNAWSWIESTLALGARISREREDFENMRKYIEKIKKPLTIGSDIEQKIKEKALMRRLKGMLLHDTKINTWKERNDTQLELEFRIAQMKELCFIGEMGGSEEYTKETVEEKFKDNLEEINKILSLA